MARRSHRPRPTSSSTQGAALPHSTCSALAGDLTGKVLVDISNPLDFSAGFPPTLAVKDTDSLGEQVQRAFPDTFVVKTLNTLTAEPDGPPRPAARSRPRCS